MSILDAYLEMYRNREVRISCASHDYDIYGGRYFCWALPICQLLHPPPQDVIVPGYGVCFADLPLWAALAEWGMP